MKIKRYTADSMRAALALVRAEQGPDAVILSSRRGEEGIEVIAAIDYDEALFADVRPKAAAVAAPEPAPPATKVEREAPAIQVNTAMVDAVIPAAAQKVPGPRVHAASSDVRPAMAPAAVRMPLRAAVPPPKATHAAVRPATIMRPGAPVRPSPAMRPIPAMRVPPTVGQSPSVPPAPARPDPAYGAMHRELQDLRRLMETGLAGMTWNDRRLREPLQARVLEELSAMDIAPDVAMALASLTPKRTSLNDPKLLPSALLCKYLPIITDNTCVNGGVTAIVGPTGAGKTTTIAKLAARWSMQHGAQDLALVSTDSYRIGAREQLNTYARILGAPMYAANSGKELGRILSRLSAKKLVLIDTAGMGPRDVRLTEQLSALQLGAARARVLLALPAQGEAQALDEIVRAFARVNPLGCILTKVDEAASLGAVLSAALRNKMKIAYVCDGQRVPEDLHAAAQRRVWLVRAALQMKERAPPSRGDAYMARHFGRAPAHA